MKRRFVDLHLRVPPADLIDSASWVSALDVDVVGLALDTQSRSTEASVALTSLRAEGIEAHLRLDVDPAQPGNPLRRMAPWRQEFEMIAGAVTSTRGLRALLRSNVDILFATLPHSRLLGPSLFRSIARAEKPWEVNLQSVVAASGVQRGYALKELSRQMRLAAEARLTVILSSGALSIWEMRSPREMANILTLLGLDLGSAMETVSSNPLRVLKEAARLGGKRP